MGKNRQRQNRNDSSSSRRNTTRRNSSSELSASTTPTPKKTRRTVAAWCYAEKEGIQWVLGCALMGWFFGLGIGTGHLTGGAGIKSQWRDALGVKIRSSTLYKFTTFPVVKLWTDFNRDGTFDNGETWWKDPGSDTVFDLLREAVVRVKGGYVHPDLGFLSPAPCGAARGIGMVRSSYTACQSECIPGIASEKLEELNNKNKNNGTKKYKQEEVLLKIPIGAQITRNLASETLYELIPQEVMDRVPLEELDDAAILVLFLAHERGVGQLSAWYPYIVSLPTEPSCGYSLAMRPYMLDSIAIMAEQLAMDVNGWPAELAKATQYSDRIASGLARDYGAYIKSPEGVTINQNIQWALCQVASRATAGSERYGNLRLVPIIDMINHDANAGGFVELTGQERLEKGDFIDATEDDHGAFVVRSLRHGKRKPLRVGQELMADYNVPGYSPLDWLISLGFVPPERWHRWTKIDAALPRVRQDGPFAV